MKIFNTTDNVFYAVEAVAEHGVAAVHGTKTPAVEYCNRIIEALEPYEEISPTTGYENIPNQGYLYFVFDLNRFSCGDNRLLSIINELGSNEPI